MSRYLLDLVTSVRSAFIGDSSSDEARFTDYAHLENRTLFSAVPIDVIDLIEPEPDGINHLESDFDTFGDVEIPWNADLDLHGTDNGFPLEGPATSLVIVDSGVENIEMLLNDLSRTIRKRRSKLSCSMRTKMVSLRFRMRSVNLVTCPRCISCRMASKDRFSSAIRSCQARRLMNSRRRSLLGIHR